ncbi:hypothetical protein AWB71_05347 [Caballeronia peredens]|nr:hypothetical protein AWB71_05347 [Caballeronia peredens]
MSCPNCIKEGLAILPVRYAAALSVDKLNTAVAPKDTSKDKSSATTSSNKNADPDVLPGSLGENVTNKKLKGSKYILRQLDRGFVYVLYPTKGTRASRWMIYEVGPDACMNVYTDPRQVPAKPMDKPMKDSCKKKEHNNISAQTIAIASPKSVPHVWMAFTRYRFSPKVLGDLEGAPEPRMQKLDVQAALKGTKLPKHGFAPEQANLVGYIADFYAASEWKKVSGALLSPLNARHDQAAAVQAQMKEISQKAEGKGLVFALFDPIGITADLNGFRNQKTGELAAYQKQHARERFVGDTILGLKKSFEDQGNASLWTEKFGGRYDPKKLNDDLNAQTTVTNDYNARIDVLADDVAKWNGAYRDDARWKDFDDKDDQSACDLQIAYANCVLGAGKTQPELDLWDKWMLANPKDPLEPLWKSLSGSAPGLLAILFGSGPPDIGRMDKMTDTVKGGVGVYEDAANIAAKMKAMAAKLSDVHAKFAGWRAGRAASEAQGVIGLAAGSQLARFAKVHPAEFEKVGIYLLMVITATTTTVFDGQTLVVRNVNELVLKMYRAVRPPQSAPLKTVKAVGQASKTTYVASAEGVMQVVEEQTVARRIAVGIWVPAEAVEGTSAAAIARAAKMLPAPDKVNQFEKILEFSKSKLSWVGFVLACLNMTSASMAIASPSPGESAAAHAATQAAFVSGGLMLLGASAELVSMAIEKGFITSFLWQNAARVAFAGGLLGAVSTAAEGLQMYYKFRDRKSVGNDGAAWAYLSSAKAFAIATAASVGGAFAAGSAAGVFTGSLSFLAPVGAAAAIIPVGGWIIVGVIAVGVGCYYAYHAAAATSAPLQDWVAQSYYGTAPSKYSDAVKESSGLRDALYAYNLETEWSGNPSVLGNAGSGGFDAVCFTLTLPGATVLSVIRCSVSLKGDAGSQTIFNEEIHPATSFNGDLTDPHIPEMRAMPTGRQKPLTFFWEEAPRLSKNASGAYQYRGILRLDSWQYTSVVIDLQYLPDPADPKFVIPSTGNPVNVTRSALSDPNLVPVM